MEGKQQLEAELAAANGHPQQQQPDFHEPLDHNGKLGPDRTELASTGTVQGDKEGHQQHPDIPSSTDVDVVDTKSKTVSVGLLDANKKALYGVLLKVRGAIAKLDANPNAFFLFPPEHRARKFATWLVSQKWFENAVLGLIVANILFLAMDNPLCTTTICDASPHRFCCKFKVVSGVMEYVFTGAFTVEILLQSLSKCFILGGSGAYLRSGWSWLDFSTVAISYLTYLPLGGAGGQLTGLRALRALRPLRTIRSIPGMRRLVQTLLESVPLLGDVFVLLLWLFFVFGIIGLNLFAGKLRGRCLETLPDNSTQVVPGLEDQPCSLGGGGSFHCSNGAKCIETNSNPNHNTTSYDQFGWVSLGIFQTLTLEAWTDDQMFMLTDVTFPAAPIIYYIILVLFGAFFAMQLLVAIISSKFAQLDTAPTARGGASRLATFASSLFMASEEEMRRNPLKRMLTRMRTALSAFRRDYLTAYQRQDLRPWRRHVWDLIHSKHFGNVVTAFILTNTVTMAMDYPAMDEKVSMVLEYINLGLTCGFMLEMLLKHIGLGVVGYWSVGFNVLDGVIVASSIVELAMVGGVSNGSNSGTSSLRTFRLLRVLRSLKLLAHIKSLQKMMKMVLMGFVALKDFMMLLSLFIFIFSILGMQVFGGLPAFSPQQTDLYRSNFDSLWQAAYTVFQLLTGADWVGIMRNGMLAKGTAACLYFISWIIIGHFALLTLFLAILITNFTLDEDNDDAKHKQLDQHTEGKPGEQGEQPGTFHSGEHPTEGPAQAVEHKDASQPQSRAFRARVEKRLDAKLDRTLVRRMRKWLVMMDFIVPTMSAAEVTRLREDLSEDWAAGVMKDEEVHLQLQLAKAEEAKQKAKQKLLVPEGAGLQAADGGAEKLQGHWQQLATKVTTGTAWLTGSRPNPAPEPGATDLSPVQVGRLQRVLQKFSSVRLGGVAASHEPPSPTGGPAGGSTLRESSMSKIRLRVASAFDLGRGASVREVGADVQQQQQPAAYAASPAQQHLVGAGTSEGATRCSLEVVRVGLMDRNAPEGCRKPPDPAARHAADGGYSSQASSHPLPAQAPAPSRQESPVQSSEDGSSAAIPERSLDITNLSPKHPRNIPHLAPITMPQSLAALGPRLTREHSDTSQRMPPPGSTDDACIPPVPIRDREGRQMSMFTNALPRLEELDGTRQARHGSTRSTQDEDESAASGRSSMLTLSDAVRAAIAAGVLSSAQQQMPQMRPILGLADLQATKQSPDSTGGRPRLQSPTTAGIPVAPPPFSMSPQDGSPQSTTLSGAHRSPSGLPAPLPGSAGLSPSHAAEGCEDGRPRPIGRFGMLPPMRLAVGSGTTPPGLGRHDRDPLGSSHAQAGPLAEAVLTPALAILHGDGSGDELLLLQSASKAFAQIHGNGITADSPGHCSANRSLGDRFLADLHSTKRWQSTGGDDWKESSQAEENTASAVALHDLQGGPWQAGDGSGWWQPAGEGDRGETSCRGGNADVQQRRGLTAPVRRRPWGSHKDAGPGTSPRSTPGHGNLEPSGDSPGGKRLRSYPGLMSAQALTGLAPFVEGLRKARRMRRHVQELEAQLSPQTVAESDRSVEQAHLPAAAATTIAGWTQMQRQCSSPNSSLTDERTSASALGHAKHPGVTLESWQDARVVLSPRTPPVCIGQEAEHPDTASPGIHDMLAWQAADCSQQAQYRNAADVSVWQSPNHSLQRQHDHAGCEHGSNLSPWQAAGPVRPLQRDHPACVVDSHSHEAEDLWELQYDERDGVLRSRPGPVAEATSAAAVVARRVARQRKQKQRAEAAAAAAAAGQVVEQSTKAEGALEDTGEKKKSKYDNSHMQYRTLFLFTPDNRLRIWLNTTTQTTKFEYFILLLILFSSVLLALDGPTVEKGSDLGKFLGIADIVFTSIFAVEMLIKLICKGFILHPGSYCRNFWDVLDGIIVTTSILSLLPLGGGSGLTIIRTLRLLRALRPLRMISRLESMRLVVDTLVRSMPSVGNVVLFGIFEFGVFGILGVQLFGGKLSSCNDSTVMYRTQCHGRFVCQAGDRCNQGVELARHWSGPFLNFDHIGRAMLTLFVVSTLDSFMEVAYFCMDAVAIGEAPRLNHSPAMGLYVMVFVFLGSFFWVNLMVSVIIDHYSRIINEKGDAGLVTAAQKEWMKIMKFAPSGNKWKHVPRPHNPVSALAYDIASRDIFDTAIMTTIILNVLVMAMYHYPPERKFSNALDILNALFTCIFVTEMLLKLAALGLPAYWADNWNKLDMIIVATSVPDLVFLAIGGAGANTKALTVLRIMRIGRMFKLVQNAKGLRTLFNTLIISLPAILNVGSLVFLLMFVYAVLGMNLFGDPKTTLISSRHANFTNFGTSLLSLFAVFTGDGWSDIMADASGCTDRYHCRNNGMSAVVAIFFCSFVVFASFVMLNLVIAVILDKFIESAQSEGLLSTNNFLDLLRMKIVLDHFVRLMRRKLDREKRLEAQRQLKTAVTARKGSAFLIPLISGAKPPFLKSFKEPKDP